MALSARTARRAGGARRAPVLRADVKWSGCKKFDPRWQPERGFSRLIDSLKREFEGWVLNRFLWISAVAAFALPAAAVEIDGRIGADEWKDARHVTDFRKVQPLNGEPATLTTEAWILATPEGLAVAFRNVAAAVGAAHPAARAARLREQVDRVNVMVDFDGDTAPATTSRELHRRLVYDAIITNENNFNTDWDGNWQHAVTTTRRAGRPKC
jgi:hypothetical protein